MCNIIERRIALTIVTWKSNITYSDCVLVAVFITQSKRMRHIVVSSVSCLAILFSYIISQTARFFERNLTDIKCVLSFCIKLPENFLVFRGIQRDTIINAHRYLCKASDILVRHTRIFGLVDRFVFKILK
jgi:hypothetical protein